MSDGAAARRASPRSQLERCLTGALRAVDAEQATAAALTRDGARLRVAGRAIPDDSELVVLAAGKAAAAMARAVEARAGDRVRSGLVVTKDGHGLPLAQLPVRETAHPVPDARGVGAAQEALALVAGARAEDTLLLLLSGGASALWTAPLPGLELGDLVATTEALLACGADIEEINCVRKHLSLLTGGRLVQEARCNRVEVLAVSDVPGDRVEVIGSGPAAADPTRYADALAVLERRGIEERVPGAVREHLERGVRGERPESLKPGARELARVRHTVIACNADARRAAVEAGRSLGMNALDLGEILRGEARVVGRRLAGVARCTVGAGPTLLVAGGETTVTLRGRGRGGRSQELALAAALELRGEPHAALLAAGTDGSDGPTDAAGAFADGGTVARSDQDAAAALAHNDAYGFFDAEGGLLRTGPTQTNVMDLVLVFAG
ncbi:MAG: DUF4147 domain-containing protein [Proteobacteria bacterium]|nr:DUF4147 domain-containing protein [Pseudomonadota bacterium]